MNHPDHTTKSRVAAISVFASAGMAAAKFAVGIAIGSLALISEALHSSVDVVACVLGGPERRTLYCLSAATSYEELRQRKWSSRTDAVEVEVAGAGNP